MSKPRKWTIEIINRGVEQFLKDAGHLPTARDFDSCEYLPSARQVQRLYGGLPALRLALGISQLNYTKGNLRRAIALKGYVDGLSAEERLETILVNKFGEPYVHTQKRYGNHLKNRYDFFIYCKNDCFAVDVFNTGRPEYIATNIRHKLSKYKELGAFNIYFVAAGHYTDVEMELARNRLPALSSMLHIVVVSEQQFLRIIETKEALGIPIDFKSLFSSSK